MKMRLFPYFYDVVNLWVPIFDHYSPLSAPPDRIWGRISGGMCAPAPREPYPNNFIDHPAINHRIRFWQMDRYDVDGSLYWSVTYWRQNPWEQAMSIDHNGGPWGNGDGRLLYPPQPEKSETPLIEGPVSSIRFENLRDGLEDREYSAYAKSDTGQPRLHRPSGPCGTPGGITRPGAYADLFRDEPRLVPRDTLRCGSCSGDIVEASAVITDFR